ncbi:MAG: VOC family protein [Pseudomonadota bacterium]
MTLNTYLFFDGNCQEAFEFYRSVFGGEFSEFHLYAEMPDGPPLSDEEKARVMHVSLPMGTSVLMGSDSCQAFGGPPTSGDNFAISIEGQSKAHCDDLCAKLSAGGTVKMPMGETFWGAYFGNWTDKFGINWMINFSLDPS